MSLRDAVPAHTIDTSSHDIVDDFFVPMLQNAKRYDRGVGYFSSGWLRAHAQGMVEFAENGGRARWITSPNLTEADWEHLRKGEHARRDAVLREALAQNIEDLEQSLKQDTLSALAWMVADGILDFRLALPHEKLSHGEFHDKFGIFEDKEENRVSFNGSYNDSKQGLRNYESLKIFCSWDQRREWVENDIKRFETLWGNDDPNVQVFKLPEAARARIINFRSDKRPYPEPEEPLTYPTDYGDERVEEPSLELWSHQKEAIQKWEENGRVGLWNMATGSGKTIAALAAAERQPKLELLVVAVPTNNLVEQWEEELLKFTDFPEPMRIYGSSARWQDRLFNKMRAAHRNGWPEPLVLIGSLDSLSRIPFQSVITDAGLPEHAMLIADEVHNVGAPTYQRILKSDFSMRLGLSATPERHFDEEGTETIMEYFGGEIFAYTMREALDDNRLSPYTYHTCAAPLSVEEYEEYLNLTRRILAERSSDQEGTTLFTNNKVDEDSDDVEQLLYERARILKKATAKTDLLADILDEHPFERGLIYCADKEQLQEVHEILRDLELVHLKYIGETPKEERRTALKALANGQVPAILAIDCLDEGVDVPAADTAIILASSTNERQFVQRRGRVLRKASDKDHATLIDVLALPPPSLGRDGKWILKSELARAKTMAELADNHYEALRQLKQHTKQYGVLLTELLSDDAEKPVREPDDPVPDPTEGGRRES
ncbi:DEAD/DEAH box helicase family protein [Salinibacter sp.]|uniref:DEAD/DEAH box helicase family protein n=1 Tax=Salinibacter sp. TaxID=2065818 RepID=UPI0021E7F49D|nr:DEAD/DEAH box helicase family protein [Salinibacter sp.]